MEPHIHCYVCGLPISVAESEQIIDIIATPTITSQDEDGTIVIANMNQAICSRCSKELKTSEQLHPKGYG